jgi:membrane protease YdiL (CAAX protease family)
MDVEGGDGSRQRGRQASGLMRGLAARMRHHPLLAFFAFTYLISWAIWLPMMAASVGIGSPGGAALNAMAIAGPSLAALVLSIGLGGRHLRDLLAGFSPSRLSVRWVLVALVLPLLMIAVAMLVGVALFGTPAPTFASGLLGIVVVEWLRILILGGPLGEELGWRGFALPRLQLRRTAFDASVVLGVIWGLWHVPLYFLPDTGQYETLRAGTDPIFAIGGFVGWTIGLSVLFTWLFNNTHGSLIVAILFHTMVNAAVYLPSAVGSTGIVSILNVAVTWLVAIAVTWRFGRATLTSPRRPSPVAVES